jgi:hypothetical protein
MPKCDSKTVPAPGAIIMSSMEIKMQIGFILEPKAIIQLISRAEGDIQINFPEPKAMSK